MAAPGAASTEEMIHWRLLSLQPRAKHGRKRSAVGWVKDIDDGLNKAW